MSSPRSRRYKEKSDKHCLSKGILKQQFEEYCSSSSIHGVQYVGDSRRPLIERWWWLGIFIVSFLMNSYMIYNVWIKWRNSPVIVSFKETTTPVWEVPFPAVTICLQVNSRKHEFSFTADKHRHDFTPQELKRRAAMSLLCGFEELVFTNSSNHLDQEDIDFLIDVAPNLDDTFNYCEIWKSTDDCSNVFSPIFTESGLCFTFNALNQSAMFRQGWSVYPYPSDVPEAKYWTLNQGYTRDAPFDLETYPRRGFDSGEKFGAYFIVMGNLSNQDSLCQGPIPGYKVILHNPAEIPLASEKYLRLPTDQEMLVLLTPNIMTTSPYLRSYEPNVRQCFFPDERQLHYFKVYTEKNCELECLANYTLKRCGCTAVFMPRAKNTPVCGGSMKTCVLDTAYELRVEELKKSRAGLKEDYCNCLPACTSISYTAETSQGPFQWKASMEAFSAAYKMDFSQYTNSTDSTFSSLLIFFTDTQFTTTHRRELYGVADFFANCGGILGLFSGISFLSFLEILYFLTFRYWSNMKRNNEDKTSDREENQVMMSPGCTGQRSEETSGEPVAV